jgi:hypothetical protein
VADVGLYHWTCYFQFQNMWWHYNDMGLAHVPRFAKTDRVCRVEDLIPPARGYARSVLLYQLIGSRPDSPFSNSDYQAEPCYALKP